MALLVGALRHGKDSTFLAFDHAHSAPGRPQLLVLACR